MSIITLISDLGHRDHYVASVKAAIYNQAPTSRIVDISHHVRAFDIHEAAFLLKSAWQQFPMGTVHVIGINSEWKAEEPQVVVHYMSHYFICRDNGIFALLLDEEPEDIFEITLPQGEDWNFPMKGIFATCAAHLSKGGAPEFLGKRITSLKKTLTNQVVIEDNAITGSVVHVDHYGNIYTNITQSDFEQARQNRRFEIELTRSRYTINKISSTFSDVGIAEQIALFATNGLLMLAMNMSTTGNGNGAAKLWGMEVKDPVRIKFYGDTNSETNISEE